MKPTLYILGMPLREDEAPNPSLGPVLNSASVIIGESPKVTSRFLKALALAPEVSQKIYFLDNISARTQEELRQTLQKAAELRQTVALFSDGGMPMLFDPGLEVFDLCKALGYTIRSRPAATSFGAACALSGFRPPFQIEGFLPQKAILREKRLRQLTLSAGNLVLLETPYRLHKFLEELVERFGEAQQTFLAWEIGSADEKLLYGTLREIRNAVRDFKAGEFVVVLAAHKHKS